MPSYLFRNASVLLRRQLRRSMSVLVHHGTIAAVTNDAIDDLTAAIIDVRGKTLMPGLIDAHAHVTGLSLSPKNLTQPASEIAIAAAHYLRSSLMSGFTTIRGPAAPITCSRACSKRRRSSVHDSSTPGRR